MCKFIETAIIIQVVNSPTKVQMCGHAAEYCGEGSEVCTMDAYSASDFLLLEKQWSNFYLHVT